MTLGPGAPGSRPARTPSTSADPQGTGLRRGDWSGASSSRRRTPRPGSCATRQVACVDPRRTSGASGPPTSPGSKGPRLSLLLSHVLDPPVDSSDLAPPGGVSHVASPGCMDGAPPPVRRQGPPRHTIPGQSGPLDVAASNRRQGPLDVDVTLPSRHHPFPPVHPLSSPIATGVSVETTLYSPIPPTSSTTGRGSIGISLILPPTSLTGRMGVETFSSLGKGPTSDFRKFTFFFFRSRGCGSES